jgi:hypothetical protein
MGLGMFRDGSAYGSAFRSNLLPAALVSSPGHRADLGQDALLQAAAFRKHSWGLSGRELAPATAGQQTAWRSRSSSAAASSAISL